LSDHDRDAAFFRRGRHGGGLISIIAGQILRAYGVQGAYPYIRGLVMLYAIAAIVAILRTPETKGISLERRRRASDPQTLLKV
jgi:uncharacterized membrane protein